MTPPEADDTAGPPPSLPRPHRRSLVAFTMVAAGCAVARHAPMVPAPAWLGLAAAALIVAALGRTMAARLALAAAAALAGAGWFALRIHEAPAGHLSELWAGAGGDAPLIIAVEGMVAEPARRMDPARAPGALAHLAGAGREASWRITVDVDRLLTVAGPVAARGRVRVWVPCRDAGAPFPAGPGERVRLSGELEPPPRPMNPGAPDRRLWAAQEGGAGVLRVPNIELVERLEPVGGAAWAVRSRWVRLIAGLRAGAAGALDAAAGAGEGGGESRAMLAALLLGEYDSAAQDVASAFTRQGLVHLLAISGFHLVVIAWAALGLIRLTGERGGLEPALVAALVVLYLLVVPAEAPVLRAGLMALAFLAAEAAGRRYDRLTVLGWIALGLILWRPMDLWSLGFQLSCGIVAVLLWQGRAWHDRLWGVPLRGTIRSGPPGIVASGARWLWGVSKGLISTSVLCWAVAAPLVAHHTGIVSPLAAPAGVLIVPLVTVLLWAGYTALALGAVAPGVAGVVGGALERLASWTAGIVRWLDHVPGTVLWLPSVSALWAAAATAVVLYWFARGHRRDRAAWATAAVVAAWLAVEVLVMPGVSWRGRARVDALSVGDGACMLVRAGRGGRGLSGEDAMLWDCGSVRTGMGLRELPRAVRALGAWRVRTAVVTHAHLDHVSALPDVVAPLGIRRVLVSPATAAAAQRDGSSVAGVLLRELRRRGVEVRVVRAGERFRLGEATVEFLWPEDGFAGSSALRTNEASLVARVTVATDGGERRVLLTGDIGPVAMGALMADGERIRADVIELPHHGSVSPAAMGFVAAVAPRVVLQSTGPRRVGDPRWGALRDGRRWLTTAAEGAVWAEIRRDGEIGAGSLHGSGERASGE